MDSDETRSDSNRLDEFTARRLARLSSMPVDTTRIDRLLNGKFPAPARRSTLSIRHLFTPMRAVAASLLCLSAIVILLVLGSTGPAIASPQDMVQFHNDLVSGKVAVTNVSSIDSANRMLSAQWSDSPSVPGVPADHVMACCMRSVKNRKVACVLLQDSNELVTMTVARASDMRAPDSPTQIVNGVTYHVQTVGKLEMVMTERNGRWICLIGQVPAQRLMQLASQLAV